MACMICMVQKPHMHYTRRLQVTERSNMLQQCYKPDEPLTAVNHVSSVDTENVNTFGWTQADLCQGERPMTPGDSHLASQIHQCPVTQIYHVDLFFARNSTGSKVKVLEKYGQVRGRNGCRFIKVTNYVICIIIIIT